MPDDETRERVAEAIRKTEGDNATWVNDDGWLLMADAAIAAYEAAPDMAAMREFWERLKEGTRQGREDVIAGRVTPLARPTEPDPTTLERMARAAERWTPRSIARDTAQAIWRAEHEVAE